MSTSLKVVNKNLYKYKMTTNNSELISRASTPINTEIFFNNFGSPNSNPLNTNSFD
jgi:hypothetical protein